MFAGSELCEITMDEQGREAAGARGIFNEQTYKTTTCASLRSVNLANDEQGDCRKRRGHGVWLADDGGMFNWSPAGGGIVLVPQKGPCLVDTGQSFKQRTVIGPSEWGDRQTTTLGVAYSSAPLFGGYLRASSAA
jgi:hypothetical protein